MADWRKSMSKFKPGDLVRFNPRSYAHTEYYCLAPLRGDAIRVRSDVLATVIEVGPDTFGVSFWSHPGVEVYFCSGDAFVLVEAHHD
jgi:hypothetical protein